MELTIQTDNSTLITEIISVTSLPGASMDGLLVTTATSTDQFTAPQLSALIAPNLIEAVEQASQVLNQPMKFTVFRFGGHFSLAPFIMYMYECIYV